MQRQDARPIAFQAAALHCFMLLIVQLRIALQRQVSERMTELAHAKRMSGLALCMDSQGTRPCMSQGRLSGPAHQVLLELVLPKRSKGTTVGRHCFGDSFSCLPTCQPA